MGIKEIIGLLGLALFFVLLVFRMRVALAMVLVGIIGTYALSLYLPYVRFLPYLDQFKTLLWQNIASYELSVVPMFIFMGYLASEFGLAQKLFTGMNAALGRYKGGVAISTIGACAGFGAVCGSSLATASTMGKIALPALKSLNYSPRLATGTIAAGGTLGILIPPSVAIVIYCVAVEASIIEMFQAALIPGLIAMLFFMLVIIIQVRLNPKLAPEAKKLPRQQVIEAYKGMLPVILVFGSVILGLSLGLFPPTPAAAVGVFLMLIYGGYIRLFGKDKSYGLNMTKLKNAIASSAVSSSMIYFILFGAEVLKGFFTRSGLPQFLAETALQAAVSPWFILIAVLLILIILGCFMESMAMILIVIPFLFPVIIAINGGEYVSADVAAFGLNNDELKIWFGILALIVIELGLITPPIGLNVFVISKIAHDVPMLETFKGVMPFFYSELIRVFVLLAFPALTLALPNLINL